MKRSLCAFILLGTAAFSECGPNPPSVIVEGPELVLGVAVGDSLQCTASLTARMGGGSDGDAEWVESSVAVLENGTGVVLSGFVEDAAQTAARWDGARITRGETSTASYVLTVPRESLVQVGLVYRAVKEGSATGSALTGHTGHIFRCTP